MDEKVIPILIESLGINRRYRGHDIAVGAIRRLGNSEGVAAYSLHRNVYEPLAEAYKRVDKHIMGLVNYFDSLYN